MRHRSPSRYAGSIFNPQPRIKWAGPVPAAGVLIDAFVVRMVFIPATMALAGDKAWWIPGWLDRLLPDLDVEGDTLARKIPLPRPARQEEDRTTQNV